MINLKNKKIFCDLFEFHSCQEFIFKNSNVKWKFFNDQTIIWLKPLKYDYFVFEINDHNQMIYYSGNNIDDYIYYKNILSVIRQEKIEMILDV